MGRSADLGRCAKRNTCFVIQTPSVTPSLTLPTRGREFEPISSLLRDPSLTEIMINAPDAIYVEREGWILQKTTTDLIDLALGLDGTYYLPYQLFYSKEQLRKAYPRVDKFFAAKRIYDPEELFTNKFYEKYGK